MLPASTVVNCAAHAAGWPVPLANRNGCPQWLAFHEPFVEESLFVLWEELGPFSPEASSFTPLVIVSDNSLSLSHPI